MDLNVLFFHGFLGKAGDGDVVRRALGNEIRQWQAWDLLRFAPGILPAEEWAATVLPQIQLERPRAFIGYSMGGRLGLHLLERDPDLFDHWIFLSVNPGLSDDGEKTARLKVDETWARRFELDPADILLRDWNSQSVFNGSVEPDRTELMAKRVEWAQCLRIWSLGRQRDFTDVLRDNGAKVHWAVGQNDAKFVKIAEDLQLPHTKVFSGGGHRLLGDVPMAVADLLRVVGQQFL